MNAVAARPTKAQMLSPEVVSSVKAYLLAKAAAQTMRERVDKIGAEMLELYPLKCKRTGELLTLKNDYRAPMTEWKQWHDECRLEQEKQGLRAGLTNPEHCPALSLEDLQRTAERLLVDVAGKPLGITFDKIMASDDCLGNLKKFVDLVCSFVVNQPGFELSVK